MSTVVGPTRNLREMLRALSVNQVVVKRGSSPCQKSSFRKEKPWISTRRMTIGHTRLQLFDWTSSSSPLTYLFTRSSNRFSWQRQLHNRGSALPHTKTTNISGKSPRCIVSLTAFMLSLCSRHMTTAIMEAFIEGIMSTSKNDRALCSGPCPDPLSPNAEINSRTS